MNSRTVIRSSSTTQRVRTVAGAALLLGAASLLMNAVEWGGPLRAWSTVLFFVVVPGLPFGLRCLPNSPLAMTVALSVSVALSILVAQLMLLIGQWDPLLAQLVLFVTSGVFLARQLSVPSVEMAA